MNIFVLNCGSSSLKYKMISMPSGEEILGGEVQRIGSKTMEPAKIFHHVSGSEKIYTMKVGGYKEAFSGVMKITRDDFIPDVFAHRLVQGGTEFRDDTIVNDGMLASLEKIKDMAPLHNPPVIELIKECGEKYPDIPQAIVLDTAFHSTIPEYAYTYPLPKTLIDELGIRKYGFHGISHQYVSEEAARFLNIPIERFNAVSCHLGSGGASLCAIVNGKSVDNSMGFSPLQGLVMSTRSGDLDPAVVLKMLAYSAGDFVKVSNVLNKKSGVLGLSGTSSDIRDIINKVAHDERSDITLDIYLWRIKKYLGAYLTVVGKTDAIIFTDTIGETMASVRESICENMEFFGVKLDKRKNGSIADYPADIASPESKVRVVVIKTNEELAIAKRAYKLLSNETRRFKRKKEERVDEEYSCINS